MRRGRSMKRSSLTRVGILVALALMLLLSFAAVPAVVLAQDPPAAETPTVEPPTFTPTATTAAHGYEHARFRTAAADIDADRRRCFSHRHHHAGRNRDARPGWPRDDSGAGDRGPVWHGPGCVVRRRRHPARQERQVVRLLLTIEQKSRAVARCGRPLFLPAGEPLTPKTHNKCRKNIIFACD